MQRTARFSKWTFPVLALSVIGQMLFNGPVLIGKAAGNAVPSPTYWSNCVNLARQQAIRPQTPEPSALDGCYQRLLAKFGMKLLSDISTNPPAFFSGLLQMKKQDQQPSVVQWFIHLGAKSYSAVQEKQELTSVDSDYVDQGKVNLKLVKGYNAAVDKPLFDQFVKQQLPTLSNQGLDQWFTSAILALQAGTKQACNVQIPRYNSPPRVDATVDSSHEGDVTYQGGRVIDGMANVYMIFWIDASFQPPSPKYVSLTEQFVKDIGQSPLYADALQYRDSLGRCPTGARLAGTFIDRQPFPQKLVAARESSSYDGGVEGAAPFWKAEVQDVAQKQGWNMQDYHNVFMLLPTINWGCGWHLNLGGDKSTYVYGSYPYYQGQEQCVVVPQSPNHDHIADIATGIISHELMEAVSDPYGDGWLNPNAEIADKCPLPPDSVDPQTNGNVTWNGHHYAIQEEYDNLRHGCVLESP